MNFKPGDLVKHKSGIGPLMTIKTITMTSFSQEKRCICTYYSRTHHCFTEASFAPEELEYAEKGN